MHYLTGTIVSSDHIIWQHFQGGNWEQEEGLKIGFHFTAYSHKYQRREVIKSTENILVKNNIDWIQPGRKEWEFNLNKIREVVPELSLPEWFDGIARVEPDIETEEKVVFDKSRCETNVAFYITPETIRGEELMDPVKEFPVEILDSIQRFKKDHPEPTKTAFIMMKFGETKAHKSIVEEIRSTLASVGIEGLRADDKQYHDDLFPNILTYMYGCDFGIAVFERIEQEEFNPNVSLEVGYMLALKKSVCLIKDKTLRTLHTDLVGKLYRGFDPLEPGSTISDTLKKWLSDKGLI